MAMVVGSLASGRYGTRARAEKVNLDHEYEAERENGVGF